MVGQSLLPLCPFQRHLCLMIPLGQQFASGGDPCRIDGEKCQSSWLSPGAGMTICDTPSLGPIGACLEGPVDVIRVQVPASGPLRRCRSSPFTGVPWIEHHSLNMKVADPSYL